jgi:hypothetical protein
MAGLQYNFFPTDFFYPRPKSAASDVAGKAVLHLQQDPGKDAINNFGGPKTLVHNKVAKVEYPLMHKKRQVLAKDHDECQN